jgi:hypothetical protein
MIGTVVLQCSYLCFIYFFIYFGGTGYLSQGFMLAGQALYHLSHNSSPFHFGNF